MQRVTALAVLGLALTCAATTVAAQEQLARTVLPIAEPKRSMYRELDARQATPPARFEVKAPAGAPNVVIVLIDDIGFGGPSTFGGPIRTPTIDFAYDGGGVGKGGKATLSVNGQAVAEGRVEKTQPNIFSADETADVGIDNQTPVAEGIGIGPETRFTGKINKITLEVSPVK
jgi:hypothetical protein